MRYTDAAIPAGMAWTSPFVRWQGSLAEVSSFDVAADVTRRALRERRVDPGEFGGLVYGWTVPQPETVYGVAALGAKTGAPHLTGPMVSQCSVTSVACLGIAAAEVSSGTAGQRLVVAADRTSNGPTLHYPAPSAPGGAPVVTNWVLSSCSSCSSCDAMADTAGQAEADELAALRSDQYAKTLAGGIQREYLVPVDTGTAVIDADEGTGPDAQAHPADGAAGAVVTTTGRARELARGAGVARILATGSVSGGSVSGGGEPACQGGEPLYQAARAALRAADLRFGQVDAVTTYSPFAAADLGFAKRTGFPAERMNIHGCGLIYGHPPAPAGLRSVAELVAELRRHGGGVGLFAGCAAGGTASALVLRVDD